MLTIENKKIYKFLRALFFSCLFLIGLLLTVKINAHQYDGIFLDPNYYFHLHDDQMITQRVAYNFWFYGKPYYNISSAIAGNTSLFWPIIISPLYSFIDYQIVIVVMFLISALLSSLVIFFMTFYEEDDLKVVFKTLLLLLTPATVSYATSGWEHIPQAVLITFSFLLIQNEYKKKGRLIITNLSLIILSLSFLLRPDSAPLILVTGCYWLMTNVYYNGKIKNSIYVSLITVAICLAMLLSYLYGMMYFYSDIFPNTYYHKQMSLGDSLFSGVRYILNPTTTNLWFYVFVFVLLFYSKLNQVQKFFVHCISLQILYIIWVGGGTYENGRFLILIIPILIILFVDTLDIFLRSKLSETFVPKVRGVIIILFLFAQYLQPINIKNLLHAKFEASFYSDKEGPILSQMILADVLNKTLDESDGSIGLHYAGIGYHLPKFNITDFMGLIDAKIAHSDYKNLRIGHNKWDYEYSFSTYDIAAVPIWVHLFEKVKKDKADLNNYEEASVQYILDTKNYEFLYPDQMKIKQKTGYGMFVRKDLLYKFVN
jgi:hypothetical protein